MSTLYRKYRPQDFNEVVGQNHIKTTLQHELETGKIAHAYLFCGPRAVGKTTLSRVFSKALNCENRKEGESNPCNKCSSCLDISKNNSLDIIEIDAASHTGVDNVRENIINASRLAPTKSKYKVFIIDEVHMLSINAFNALLKIMEEPPSHVIFILCTTEIHKVPTTVISRCQRFDFKKIGFTDSVNKLNYIIQKEKIKVNKKVIEAIVRKAEGHMRDAESVLGQIISISDGGEISEKDAELIIPVIKYTEIFSLIEHLSKSDIKSSIELINKLFDEGLNLENFTSDTIEMLRKLMIFKISPSLESKINIELGPSYEGKINDLGQNLDLENIIFMIENFRAANEKIKNSFIVQLPLEIAIIKSCSKKTLNKLVPNDTKNQKVVENNIQNINIDKKSNNNNLPLNKEMIFEKWSLFLSRVKKENHSLAFVLKVCEPRSFSGNNLKLAFKYKFHKDRLDEINIKHLVEKVLEEVYQSQLKIETILDENLKVDNTRIETAHKPITDSVVNVDKGDNMMDNMMQTFGKNIVKP